MKNFFFFIGFLLIVNLAYAGNMTKTMEKVKSAQDNFIQLNDVKTNSLGMKFVLIPAGTFLMGSPKSELGHDYTEEQHKVSITKSFYLQTTEVTQGQWERVMGNNPSFFLNCGKDCPVENVSFYDVEQFIKKLNEIEKDKGVRYRLPTEAEWEYACRAGTYSAFNNGGSINETNGFYNKFLSEVGWYYGNSKLGTHPVAQKKPNKWGLYDMHGNVWEWVSDWYAKYPFGYSVDKGGPPKGWSKVRRGGSWRESPFFCRCAYRGSSRAEVRAPDVGFRLVMELVPVTVQKQSLRQKEVSSQVGSCDKNERCFGAEILFDLNSYNIRPDMEPVLEKIINFVKTKRKVEIYLSGYTCDLASADYNLKLSKKRVDAVKKYLIENGVDPRIIYTNFYGEKRPEFPNTCELNRSRNRRVEIRVFINSKGYWKGTAKTILNNSTKSFQSHFSKPKLDEHQVSNNSKFKRLLNNKQVLNSGRKNDSEIHKAKQAAEEKIKFYPHVVSLFQPSSFSQSEEVNSSYSPRKGIWLSGEDIARLPTAGLAWMALKKYADQPIYLPNLSDLEVKENIKVLAKALVYAKTQENIYRDEVIDAIMFVMGTERGGTTLSVGTKLVSYIIAADLVGLPPEKEKKFREWLKKIRRTKFIDGKTIAECHEIRPNNWGTNAGVTRIAIDLYLNDHVDLARAAKVFKGWLGDWNSYHGFKFGRDLSWQANPLKPLGINPQGAIKLGHPIDGVLPDDQRRSGPFRWPPPKEGYVYAALQGAVGQAILLNRAGYKDVWQWADKALLRAFKWLYYVANFPAERDDTWLPYVINYYYKVHLPTSVPARPGKNIGFTDWIYGSYNF